MNSNIKSLRLTIERPRLAAADYTNTIDNIFKIASTEALKVFSDMKVQTVANNKDPVVTRLKNHVSLHSKVSLQLIELKRTDLASVPEATVFITSLYNQKYGLGQLTNLLTVPGRHDPQKEQIIQSLSVIKNLLADVELEELVTYNIMHDLAKYHNSVGHEENSAWLYDKLKSNIPAWFGITFSPDYSDIFECVIFNHVLFGLLWIDGNWAALTNLFCPPRLNISENYHLSIAAKMNNILASPRKRTLFFKRLALYTLLDIAAADGKQGYLNNLRVKNITGLIESVKTLDFSSLASFIYSKEKNNINSFRQELINVSLLFVKNSDHTEIQESAGKKLLSEIEKPEYHNLIPLAAQKSVHIIRRDYVHSLYVLLGTNTSDSAEIYEDYSSFLKLNLLIALGCATNKISFVQYRYGRNFDRLAPVDQLKKYLHEFWNQLIKEKNINSENQVANIKKFLSEIFFIDYTDFPLK